MHSAIRKHPMPFAVNSICLNPAYISEAADHFRSGERFLPDQGFHGAGGPAEELDRLRDDASPAGLVARAQGWVKVTRSHP